MNNKEGKIFHQNIPIDRGGKTAERNLYFGIATASFATAVAFYLSKQYYTSLGALIVSIGMAARGVDAQGRKGPQIF